MVDENRLNFLPQLILLDIPLQPVPMLRDLVGHLFAARGYVVHRCGLLVHVPKHLVHVAIILQLERFREGKRAKEAHQLEFDAAFVVLQVRLQLRQNLVLRQLLIL